MPGSIKSRYFVKLPNESPYSPGRWSEGYKWLDEGLESSCKLGIDASQPLREVHVGGEWSLMEELIEEIKPVGLLISIHRSLIAITFMDGSVVFLLKRGSKQLQALVCRLFSTHGISLYASGEFTAS